MKVYRINSRDLPRYIGNIAEHPMDEIAMNILIDREPRFRYEDLRAYGMRDDEINAMLGSGFLDEAEVSEAEARKIAAHHRFNLDPAYREWAHGCMKRARQTHRGCIRKRRALLLNNIIFPLVAFQDGNGEIFNPEKIYPWDIVDAIEQQPELRALYPKNLRPSLYSDINYLGIPRVDRVTSLKYTWQQRLGSADGEALRTSRRRAKQAQLKLHEKYPERAQRARDAQSRSRKLRMKRDPKFHNAVMSNLEKATHVLTSSVAERRAFLLSYIEDGSGDVFSAKPLKLLQDVRSNGNPHLIGCYEIPTGYRLMKEDLLYLRRQQNL